MPIRVLSIMLFAVALPLPSMVFADLCGHTNDLTATVFCSSTAEIVTTHNTATSQQVNSFAVQLIGHMQGGSTLYDQTFNVALSNPQVQAALVTAEGVLTGSGATSFFGPNLISIYRSLVDSMIQTVQDRSQVSQVLDVVGIYVGPWTFTTGDLGTCRSYQLGVPRGNSVSGTGMTTGSVSISDCLGGAPQSDTLLPGQVAIDLTQLSLVDLYTTTTTTNTYLTKAVYELVGLTSVAAVPEPAIMALVVSGLLAMMPFGGAFSRAKGKRCSIRLSHELSSEDLAVTGQYLV